MSDRCSAISADVGRARERLLSTNTDDKATPTVCRLDHDDDSITFAVRGYEGEFTAFLADPYPGGQTTVYGPDDLEFCFTGTVLEVMSSVLGELRDRLSRRECGKEVLSSSPERSPMSADIDALELDAEDEDWQEIVEETPMESCFFNDVTQVRSMLGTDAVIIAQLSLETWRVRLQCPLQAPSSTEAYEHHHRLRDTELLPLIDETTAGAWGMHPTKPLVIELHLPAAGYLREEMSAKSIVKAVWQDGHPKFALEKQMMKILSEFCMVAIGKGTLAQSSDCKSDMTSVGEHSTEELETLRKYETKKASMLQEAQNGPDMGFLANMVHYAQLRIPTMHEYCAICDKPFAVPPMLLRTVCCRDLCTYQFGEFGDKITSAEGVNTQAEIVDLLVCMLMRAALSQRRDLILDPYPRVYGGKDGTEVIFNPKSKDNKKLQKTVESILRLRQERIGTMGASWSALKSQMGVEAASLVAWVVASNRSYLAPLDDDRRISSFQTPFQYLLISAPPEKEREFQCLKQKHGSKFAYHGSPTENWHSILRNGLKNASDTKLMTTGKAYGPGIYLATDSQTSLGYAMRSHGLSWLSGLDLGGEKHEMLKPEMKRQKTGNRFLDNVDTMVMLAVCEVIDHPSLKRHGSIWVAPQEETVITRLFLVFTDIKKMNNCNIPISGLESQIRECMQKLHVGTVGRGDPKSLAVG